MGLAIDGNEVHGIARGGQAFVSLGNTNTDGSINIGGQDYLSKNKMKIKSTKSFDINIEEESESATIDVTDKLSNYGGCLAICVIHSSSNILSMISVSQPIIIPTAPTTYKFSLEDSSSQNDYWSGSLSMTTENGFTFVSSYGGGDSPSEAFGNFWILSNN